MKSSWEKKAGQFRRSAMSCQRVEVRALRLQGMPAGSAIGNWCRECCLWVDARCQEGWGSQINASVRGWPGKFPLTKLTNALPRESARFR